MITFKPGTWEAEAGDHFKFKASLVYFHSGRLVSGLPELRSETRQLQKSGHKRTIYKDLVHSTVNNIVSFLKMFKTTLFLAE